MLQTSADDTPKRPAWQFVLIGAGFTVTLWLPLAMLATALGAALAWRVLGAGAEQSLEAALASASAAQKAWAALAQALPLALSFFLSCLMAAALVGRFGENTTRRHAVYGNLLGSAVVLVLGGMAGELSLAIALGAGVVLALSSVGGGWLGVRWGKSRRLRSGS